MRPMHEIKNTKSATYRKGKKAVNLKLRPTLSQLATDSPQCPHHPRQSEPVYYGLASGNNKYSPTYHTK